MYGTFEFLVIWFYHLENSAMDMTKIAIGAALVSRSISIISILVCVPKSTTTSRSSTKIKIAVDSSIYAKSAATWMTYPIVTLIFMSQHATFCLLLLLWRLVVVF